MDGWMYSKKRRKETRGTWSLALGAHRHSMARGPEAEQVMGRTEMKDGLGAMELTGRASVTGWMWEEEELVVVLRFQTETQKSRFGGWGGRGEGEETKS